MGSMLSLFGVGRSGRRETSRGRKPPQHRRFVEAVERTCQSIEGAAVGAMGPPAMIEALEDRTLLSTFNAFIANASTGSHSQGFTVNLWTTGLQATSWDIDWGDLSAHTVLNASSYPGGVFPVPVPATHTYLAGTYKITATATPTSGPAMTATDYLNAGFGNVTNQGETLYNPNSGHNTPGKGIVVDASGNTHGGDVYALSLDNGYAAVTRFTSAGAVDSTFGTSGTITLSHLGTGTPYSIAISPDGNWVAVSGTFGGGWGVGEIDTAYNNGQGQEKWWKPDVVTSGIPYAVAFESAETPTSDALYAAGFTSSGTTCCMAALELDVNDGSIPSTWNGGNGVFAFSTGSCANSIATAITDTESPEGIALGGNTFYSTGSDFTIAELTDDGALQNGTNGTVNFGGAGKGYVRTNFGHSIPSGNGVVNNPSSDNVHAITIDSYGDLILAGSTNAVGGTKIALAAYYSAGSSAGGLVSGFGPYGTPGMGLSVGPSGTAYSAALVLSNDDLVIGGTVSNDYLVSMFTSGGVLDTTWASGGNFTIDFGDQSTNSTDSGLGVAVETDGSILIGGSTQPSGGCSEIALADILGPSISIT